MRPLRSSNCRLIQCCLPRQYVRLVMMIGLVPVATANEIEIYGV